MNRIFITDETTHTYRVLSANFKYMFLFSFSFYCTYIIFLKYIGTFSSVTFYCLAHLENKLYGAQVHMEAYIKKLKLIGQVKALKHALNARLHNLTLKNMKK